MSALRSAAIHWYRKVFGAPAGSDIREQGLDCVLDGNSAVEIAETSIASLAARSAEGPRGLIASAIGLALSGQRATAFLSGTDVAAAQDLLISAAGKHVPLVLHVATRAAAAHGATLGSGHETVHLSADSGFFILFAANVQEAVDFTYIARWVAEESLVPGLVVMDSEQTAFAPQDVRLLSPAQSNEFIGAARDHIEAPTAAQKLLFGDTRRRVPAWHDLDEPVLSGALFDRESFALGAFARRPFFDAFVAGSLSSAFARFAAKTGRQYESLSRYKTSDAKILILAQGAAVETAQAAADVLRGTHKVKAGVLGVHALRPFPVDDIAAELQGKDSVFVLERTAAPIAGEPPLTREVRAGLEQRDGKQRTPCVPVLYGLGGLPLRVADIVELCRRDDIASQDLWFLGVAFDDRSGDQPKREVLLDALRRAYPDVAGSAIRAPADSHPEIGKNTLAIAIRRNAEGRELLGSACGLIHALEGGRIRSHPDVSWDSWSAAGIDFLIHGDEDLHDPGAGLVADATLDVATATVSVSTSGDLYKVTVNDDDPERSEKLLGGLFAVLSKAGLLDHKARRIIAARKRQLETEAFQDGFENAVKLDVAADSEPGGPDRWKGETPEAIRHLSRDDDSFASLPRFWDQTGVLYRDQQAQRLTADPFLATGTIPPLSATFNDASRARQVLPVFEPAKCTGCGKCWTLCPDSAIGVVAASPAALIDAGISLANASAVRQVSSKLAPRIISANKKAEEAAPTFGAMLADAYAWLGEKMPLPEDRKQAISDGIEAIGARLGDLPVAVTKPFFADAEAEKKDSAELLSIVVNPDACKACGICVSECEPEALQVTAQDAETLEHARKLWSIFSSTPDTTSETVERIASNPDIGAMAAVLLSRYCQFALSGGDPAEAGSGEKIAARLALSATEFHQQPIAQRFAESLAEAGQSISELIEKTLSSTLTIDDLDAITDKLKRTASPRVDLEELASGIGAAETDHSIDTEYLLRLIHLYNQVESARHRIVEGDHGLGRARYGLAVAGGSTAEWAGAFPHNPFQAPVVIDMTGDAAQLAAGLVEGHLDETTDVVRLLRLARLEVEQPDGIEWQRDEVQKLRWQDLDADELALCPPLVLIGSDELLAGQGLGQLIWLLNSGLPVKVIVFSELDFAADGSGTNNPRANLGLLALGQRGAFVAQSSIGYPAHLGESMLQALAFEGAALLQIYAPSPSRHGFPCDQAVVQAQRAVASRALPLFRYDPRAGGVFGTRITLDGNPDPEKLEGDVTFVDWAGGQTRYASNVEALKGAATACLANWQTLQEVSGIVTPFTDKLERDIRAEVSAEHEAALDAQKKAAAAELRAVQEKTQAEIAQSIRSRLLQLATRKKD